MNETREIYKVAFQSDAPMRVDSIRIRWKVDESPDLSYLGEYSNKAEAVHIDRQERGDMGRGEYRYFNAGCGDPEYIEQDYKRMEAYQRGDWCCMGCIAEATVSYPTHGGSRRLERLSSGGLWGIESDSDAKYIAEVEQEQIAELREHLEQFEIEWPADFQTQNAEVQS